MVTSSVSPERAETMPPQPAARAASQAARVSVSVPRWFGLISSVLQRPPPPPRAPGAASVTRSRRRPPAAAADRRA